MSFSCEALRVLIASPSDVATERDLAVEVIQDWNNRHSAERGVVLLPMRWETHSAPEYGRRPQETINIQVVDNCDLAIGIFWTRIGSPTGSHDSGTLEEIERLAKSQKKVLLYFSNARQSPSDIDIEQLQKLRDFKGKTYPTSLVYEYSNVSDFQSKLSSHLDIQVRELLSDTSSNGKDFKKPTTDIVFEFADVDSGAMLSTNLALSTKVVRITDPNNIPDYIDPDSTSDNEPPGLFSKTVNKDYTRQLITSMIMARYYSPIRFSFKNQGVIGARDVYVELDFKSEDIDFIVLDKDSIPTGKPEKIKGGLLSSGSHLPVKDNLHLANSSGWKAEFDVGPLQPQRKVSPEKNILVIGADKSCEITIVATIYADTLAVPVKKSLSLRLDVQELTYSASDLVEAANQV
jgi:hypothetical protein